MTSRSVAAFGAAACFLAACSGTGGGSGTVDASHGKDASQGRHDGGSDARKDAHGDPSSDAGDDVSDGGDTVMDAPFDASPYVPIDGGHAPLTNMPAETWSWVPFPESRCRDGSTTGLGVNLNPASQNLIVYLEGGGACFNGYSCMLNPQSFAGSDFAGRFPAASDGGAPEPGNGLFDRTNAANPVRDWNYVYVPYCTGDLHAGNNPGAVVPEIAGTQMFLGYQNIDLFLQRIVPTFPSAKQVLLTGVSGGGFGAALNYLHVKRAFGAIPVDLIDDSGPFFENPYVPTCFADEIRALWGFDSTVGADCAGQCNDPQTFFVDLVRLETTGNPDRTFGLLDSMNDGTIRAFFGFGDDDCTEMDLESATLYAAGLEDIRAKLGSSSNLGTFYFPGTDHTSIGDDNFYTRTTSPDAGTVALTTWFAAMLQGKALNIGP